MGSDTEAAGKGGGPVDDEDWSFILLMRKTNRNKR